MRAVGQPRQGVTKSLFLVYVYRGIAGQRERNVNSKEPGVTLAAGASSLLRTARPRTLSGWA